MACLISLLGSSAATARFRRRHRGRLLESSEGESAERPPHEASVVGLRDRRIRPCPGRGRPVATARSGTVPVQRGARGGEEAPARAPSDRRRRDRPAQDERRVRERLVRGPRLHQPHRDGRVPHVVRRAGRARRAAAALSVHDLEEMYLAAATQTRASDESLREALQATVGLQQNQPGYRELWRQLVAVSVAALREDFDTLGVSFDLWLGESHFSDRIPGLVERLLAQGHAVMSEGAVVIPVAEPQDQQEMPPLIIVKSDVRYTYATTDLAAVDERAGDLRADAILYVVDKRQGLHFTQVFRAARKTGLARNARLEHLAFGTMNGPDGKPFKTRAGGVMKLKDLIDMVTEAALQRMQDSDIATTFSETERRRLARQVRLAGL